MKSQKVDKSLLPQGGLLSSKIHCTLKYAQVVEKGSYLVTSSLKTLQKLPHCPRQCFSTLDAHLNYQGKFQKCPCPGPNSEQLNQNLWGWNAALAMVVFESC